MVASIVRGIGSVLTVVVVILVSTRVGEAATAKVLAAAISAAVIISLEWFVRWSPMHVKWARRRLDERSVRKSALAAALVVVTAASNLTGDRCVGADRRGRLVG